MAVIPWKASFSHDLQNKIPYSIALSRDSQLLAIGCSHGHIKILNAENLSERGFCTVSKVNVTWLDFLETGLTAHFGEKDLVLYSLNDYSHKSSYQHPHRVTAVIANLNKIYFADANGVINTLDSTLKVYQTAHTYHLFTSLLASQEYLWAGNDKGEILQFDKGPLICSQRIIKLSHSPILFLKLFPLGIAAYTSDEMFGVWDLKQNVIQLKRRINLCDVNDLISLGHEVTTAGHGAIICDQLYSKSTYRIEAHENTRVQALTHSIELNRLFSIGCNGRVVTWKRQVDPNALHFSV